MSILFYDHLTNLDDLKEKIDLTSSSLEEKEELWQIVDEIIHHRVLLCILDSLDNVDHADFIEHYHQCPHDDKIVYYLKEKIGDDFENIIVSEVTMINSEILKELQ